MTDGDPIRGRMQPPAPTLRELAMVLFRRKRVFIWFFGLVLGTSIFYAAAGARYQSHMKILVRPGRADAPVTAQENAPLDLTRLAITEEQLNSEVELLRDDEVLRKVVEQSCLGGRNWFHLLRFGESREQRIERIARRLAKKIQVEPMKKTNLIAVSYAANDSQQAARVLQSLANAYLEKHTVVHRPGGQVGFFEQQADESRRQLEEAKSKLLQFTAEHQVVSAAQERDLTLQKLSDIDASFRQTRVDLAETEQRVWELTQQLKGLPDRTTTQLRTADNPELLRALKSQLLDLQLKRTELLTKFEPNHRLVVEVEQEISQAQAAIAAENKSPVRDETTDKDAHYEWAKSELQQAQVQLKALQAREAATATQEIAYRKIAHELGEDAIAQDDLQNREKAAEDNYLLYVKKRDEARMADALDQRGIVNVAIAEQPVAPALPRWPTWAVLIAGLAAAGTAGTSASFAADHLDPAFRNLDEVAEYLNAPVLASLPRNPQGRLLT
jgi:polysaccharide biosynthesis protein PslE